MQTRDVHIEWDRETSVVALPSGTRLLFDVLVAGGTIASEWPCRHVYVVRADPSCIVCGQPPDADEMARRRSVVADVRYAWSPA